MLRVPIVESYWVEENLLLAGEYPGSIDPGEARKKIDSFLESGIRTFVDLTQPHELVPYEAILREEARIYDYKTEYYRFGIRDGSIPSTQTMKLILNTIDSAIEKNSPVYVHCWGGVGRTGTVVGCYFVRRGMTAQKALERLDALYKTRPRDLFLRTSPETQEQFDFVRNWRETPST